MTADELADALRAIEQEQDEATRERLIKELVKRLTEYN